MKYVVAKYGNLTYDGMVGQQATYCNTILPSSLIGRAPDSESEGSRFEAWEGNQITKIIPESANGRRPDFESGKCGFESYLRNQKLPTSG